MNALSLADSAAELKLSLPPELDAALYKRLNPELSGMSDDEASQHFARHGLAEGRRAHDLVTRRDFLALVRPSLDVLEMGLQSSQLQSHSATVPHELDAVLSSHVLAHQPDLVAHLRAVHRLLRPGGLYFVLVPDKNYCAERFENPTRLVDLVAAHLEGRTRHSPRSIFAHYTNRTHDDAERHWRGNHDQPRPTPANIQLALEHIKAGACDHELRAWYFQASTFRHCLEGLKSLGLSDFDVLRLYPTQRDSNEFWAVLEAIGSSRLDSADAGGQERGVARV